MFNHFHRNSKFLSVIIAFIFLYNSFVPAFASIYSVNQAQQYANNDIMLICSGNTYQWVSSSEYINNGIIKVVEAPENSPEKTQHLDCSFNYIADNHIDKTAALYSLADISIAYDTRILLLEQRPHTPFPYLKALTRAPPTL